jgi:hypothetical protein
VILRYFLGDRMLAEVESVDGDIGGGTTGTTTIGARFDGTQWGDFFDGVIDELRVVDYELTPEEIEATWKRISVLQPRGYRAMRDLFPPDAPISDSPDEPHPALMNLAGQALGYAAAQVENLRKPAARSRVRRRSSSGRASSPNHRRRSTRWTRAELACSVTCASARGSRSRHEGSDQRPGSDVDEQPRGAHVCAGVRRGLRQSRALLVRHVPHGRARPGRRRPACSRSSRPAAPAVYDSTQRNWITADLPISHSSIFKIRRSSSARSPGVGLSAHLLTKIAPTTMPSKAEVGVAFHDWGRNHAMLIGLRNNAAPTRSSPSEFIAGVSQGVVGARDDGAASALAAPLPGRPAARLRLPRVRRRTAATSGTSLSPGRRRARAPASRPTTSAASPVGLSLGDALLPHVRHRRLDDASLDDGRRLRRHAALHAVRRSPFHFYAYRDPALAGTPDIAGAHNVLQGLKQAQTEGTLVTSKSVICDSVNSICDRTPLGGF